MKKPVIDVVKTKNDNILEIIAILIITATVLMTGYYYDQLPDIIPRHFNANGDVDGRGSKVFLVVFTIIDIILVYFLYRIAKAPQYFNFNVKVTDENAPILYEKAGRFTRVLMIVIAAIFFYINYSTISVALGNQSGIGKSFMPIILIGVGGLVMYFIYSINKVKSD